MLAFAKRRGPLFPLRPVTAPGADVMERVVALDAGRLGEPLVVWAKEAARFAEIMEVWDAVRALESGSTPRWAGVEGARRLIAHRFRIRDGALVYMNHPSGSRFLEPTDASYARVMKSLRPDRGMKRTARYFVTLRVNESLRGEVSPAVMPFMDSAIKFWPRSLLGSMYMLLAMELAGRGARERSCAQCGQPFIPKRNDAERCGERCRSRASYLKRRDG